MSYYVVINATEAYSAVNILSESSKGKANFYVLDAFKGFKPKKKENVQYAELALLIISSQK